MCIKSNDPDPTFILRSGPHSVSCPKFVRLHNNNNNNNNKRDNAHDKGEEGRVEAEEMLISGGQDGWVRVWDLKTKRVRFKLQAAVGDVGVLHADVIRVNNKDVILTHTRNGSVKFWVQGLPGETGHDGGGEMGGE